MLNTTNAAETPPDPIRSWAAFVLAAILAALALWAGWVDPGPLAGAVVAELLRTSAQALLDQRWRQSAPTEPGGDQAEAQ